ncbi:Transmembrane Protein 61 [Manis pentadactyla]|nr:Transmembrane Protein 61 [Manis pentadactyla]
MDWSGSDCFAGWSQVHAAQRPDRLHLPQTGNPPAGPARITVQRIMSNVAQKREALLAIRNFAENNQTRKPILWSFTP